MGYDQKMCFMLATTSNRFFIKGQNPYMQSIFPTWTLDVLASVGTMLVIMSFI